MQGFVRRPMNPRFSILVVSVLLLFSLTLCVLAEEVDAWSADTVSNSDTEIDHLSVPVDPASE